MIKLLLGLWLASTFPAIALPISVKAAEHKDFTRLVVDYGAPVRWQLGRSLDGYGLRIEGGGPEYDFLKSFDKINTGRIASLQTEQGSGDLIIGMACRCYAVPFEYREGIIVVDFRDGMPPKTSEYEEPLLPLESLGSTQFSDGKSDSTLIYDWKNIQSMGGNPKVSDTAPRSNQPKIGQPSLASNFLRLELTEKLSSAASAGFLNLSTDNAANLSDNWNGKKRFQESEEAKNLRDSAAASRIGVGGLPGLSVASSASPSEKIGSEGKPCIPTEKLKISAWRGEKPVFFQLYKSRNSLLGEFDIPKKESLQSTIQFYISIGFGQEASQLLREFPDVIDDESLFSALASLVDGKEDDMGIFSAQMGCETPASMWSILGNDTVKAGDFVNAGSAYLAFSHLPAELRRSLGPSLVKRFLQLKDPNSARKLLDSVQRAEKFAAPSNEIAGAAINYSIGKRPEAEHQLKLVADGSGPSSIDALINLIEVRTEQTLPVDPKYVKILEAVEIENAGTTSSNKLSRALNLARGASGEFDRAFSNSIKDPQTQEDLWRLLANIGSDDNFLENALLPANGKRPSIDAHIGGMIASRLANLGFPTEANLWLDGSSEVSPSMSELKLLTAQSATQMQEENDSRALLGTVDRTKALNLGDVTNNDVSNVMFEHGGKEEFQGMMNELVKIAGWKTLVEAIDQNSAGISASPPSLARGHSLLDETHVTQEAVASVLSEVLTN
jgi:hypothetical protein